MSINQCIVQTLHQWQEFKMEAWFPDFLCGMSHYYWTYNTSHTFFTSAMVAWAFTTFKSVAAHHIMFHWIFAIAEHDMDIPVHFQHIHGDGFETFMQMGTRGQVLGMKWAMHIFIWSWLSYLQVLVITVNNSAQKWLATVHYILWWPMRIQCDSIAIACKTFSKTSPAYRDKLPTPFQKEMMSLATAEPLHYFKGLDLIRTGGNKAVGE